MSHILLLEDHLGLSHIMLSYLHAAGHNTAAAHTVDQARDFLDGKLFDLVIVDRKLPDGDGLDVVKSLHRNQPAVPVLIVSSRVSAQDRVSGLRTGADDYLLKPFDTEEFHLRVQKLLNITKHVDAGHLQHGKVELQKQTGSVIIEGRTVHLRPKEFALLWFLARHKNALLTRKQIMNHLWPDTLQPMPATVDVYARRVRLALGSARKYLKTIKGYGYIWKPEEEVNSLAFVAPAQ